MPDVFDQVAPDSPGKGDVFDQVAPSTKAENPGFYVPPDNPTAQGFGDNLVSSAKDMAGNIAGAVLHPIDTATELGKTAIGGIEKLSGSPIPGLDYRDHADAILNYAKTRYGGYDQLAHTAYHDPVGFAADLSSLLDAGGAGAGVIGKLTKAAQVEHVGNVLRAASEATNPLMAGRTALKIAGTGAEAAGASPEVANAIRRPLAAVKQSAADNLYQSSLLPSGTNSAVENEAIAKMGLDNGVPLNGSKNSLQKVRQIVEQRRQAIADKVAAATRGGATVDPNQVAAVANSNFRPAIANSATPSRDTARFDAEVQDYLGKHTPPAQPTPKAPPSSSLLGPNGQPLPSPAAPPAPPPPKPMAYPADVAQAEKVNTYKKINSFGEHAGPEQEANKGLAFGLKSTLENLIPELRSLNDQEGTGIGLQKAVDAFATREAKRNRVMNMVKPTVASSALSGVGLYEHNIPAAIMAHMAVKALDDPGIKSRIAIALNRSAKGTSTPWLRKIAVPASRIQAIQDLLQNHVDQNPNQGAQ